MGVLPYPTFLSLCEKYTENNDTATAQALFKARCATDVELFARHYFPHYCTKPFSQFHNDLFVAWEFGERRIRRCNGAPRGYAKSALVALIKPIHDICYGLEKFIIILSNTKPQAIGKLKDIRRELLVNTKLVRDYGISFVSSKPAESHFIVDSEGSEIMLASFGSGAEIRGIRFGEHRPSKVICDDVEHSEEVFNEEIRNKYEDWYFQVVSQVGNEETNIDFVGTVLHPRSLLKKLSENPVYNSKIYPAIMQWSEREDLWQRWREIYTDLDNDSRVVEAEKFYKENEQAMLEGVQVLWPDKEPYLYLMKELVEKGRRAFLKEKQNAPTGADDKVFEELRYFTETPEGLKIESTGKVIPWRELKHQCFGAMDPATGQTKAKKGKLGDFTCLLTGYRDTKGRLFVYKDWTKREPPTKYIREIFEHHKVFDYYKFGVETNLYRNLLLPNIVAERNRIETEEKKKIKIPFYDIENIENKEKRIYTLEPKVSHGWILFNKTLSAEFKNQLLEFPHADHDDCPDALHQLYELANNRYKASPISINPTMDG